MKNLFLTTLFAVFLIGGCEKEVAFSTNDELVFCPVHFRMNDFMSSSLTCPNGQLAPAIDQTCQTATDGQGLVFSKRLFRDARTTFYWNQSAALNQFFDAQHWLVAGPTGGGALLSFEKMEIDTGARFGLFLGPVLQQTGSSDPTIDKIEFGDAAFSTHQVWVAREADGLFSISAKGGGKDTTVAGIADFVFGQFRLHFDQNNQKMLLWAFLFDGLGTQIASIQVDADFNQGSIFADERFGVGFGIELLPDFKDDCRERLCYLRLKSYAFSSVNGSVSDDFVCNSIIRN